MKKKSHLPRESRPTSPVSEDERRGLHYSDFQIQNFRCLRDLTVGPMMRVNLIAGENNSGKTALLEALFLHSGAFNPALTMTVAGLRGIGTLKLEFGRPVQTPWSTLFSDLDESLQIRLVGHNASGRTRTIAINTTSDKGDLAAVRSISKSPPQNGQGSAASGSRADVLKWHHSGLGGEGIHLLIFDGPEIKTHPAAVSPPPFPGRFMSARWNPDFAEIAEQFGELEVEKKQDVLLNILRIIEPKLTRLSTILLGPTPMLHADVGIGKLIPVAFLGDGILRLTAIILWIIHTAGGVLLIDEVDNGFHYSHLR